MIFRIQKNEGKLSFHPYEVTAPGNLGFKEKDIENWISSKPELIFGQEQILVIAQSVSGKSMADVLALDSDGNLIIVEIKRDWSDRGTVGQLLEYAAKMSKCNYEQLNEYAKQYKKDESFNLLKTYSSFFDNPGVKKGEIGNGQRLYVVAPEADQNLKGIVDWLCRYGVPISYVPFTLFSEGDDMILEIQAFEQPENETNTSGWQGDWYFNTKDYHFNNGFKEMIKQEVIAICGFESGSYNLTGSVTGQRVFAYVNGWGVVAVGHIIDPEPFKSDSIFGEESEYHLKVKWKHVVHIKSAIRFGEIQKQCNYGLPSNFTFCGIWDHEACNWIETELSERAG